MSTYIANMFSKPLILHSSRSSKPLSCRPTTTTTTFRYFPIIYLPPPLPYPSPKALPRKCSTFIPMPPPTQHQCPQHPLHERQHDLIPSRNPCNLPPRLGTLKAGEVTLLEPEIGQWWQIRAPGNWFQRGVWDAGIGAGDGGCRGDGSFLGGGCGGIEVVSGVGVFLD